MARRKRSKVPPPRAVEHVPVIPHPLKNLPPEARICGHCGNWEQMKARSMWGTCRVQRLAEMEGYAHKVLVLDRKGLEGDPFHTNHSFGCVGGFVRRVPCTGMSASSADTTKTET